MYCPFIRGKEYDLLALRELADKISTSKKILPIIEPVTIARTTLKSFSLFCKQRMPFILIINPLCSQRINKQKVIDEIVGHLDKKDFIPALYITDKSTTQDIAKFIEYFSNSDLAFLYHCSLIESCKLDLIQKITNRVYNIFFQFDNFLKPNKEDFSETKICIYDPFKRAAKNADYKLDDYFSNNYLVYPNKEYFGFGDYSIVGKKLIETAFSAYAVVIHHMYICDSDNKSLHVRHYVSDTNNTSRNPGGKFLEALQKLKDDLHNLGKENETSVVETYLNFYAGKKFPGLGSLKKLAIMQHLELMLMYYTLTSKQSSHAA